MKRISKITLFGAKKDKQKSREELAVGYKVRDRIDENEGLIDLLRKTPLVSLDTKVKNGENLTFEEARCGMCYLLAATNNHFFIACQKAFERASKLPFSHKKGLASGAAFAQLMACKESFSGLTPEEIAGLVAGGLMDTVIRRLPLGRVIETCGMGADKGFMNKNGKKIVTAINASTYSAFVLASLGLPVIKHGSYSNTSAIGSTEAVEDLGIPTNIKSVEEVMSIWRKCGFCYLDAHWCKTIHDLSHLLMIETINHVVGPMSIPVTRRTEINKLMGVNEKIHPAVVAQAYTVLHRRRQQKIGGVAIVCGLDKDGVRIDPTDVGQVKKHAILDELSPYASVVSVAYRDRFLGTFLVEPSDFGIELDPESIKIANTKRSIRRANEDALSGKNPNLSKFLAMNAALGLFVERYLGQPTVVLPNGLNREFLGECSKICLEAIFSGGALSKLEEIRHASK